MTVSIIPNMSFRWKTPDGDTTIFVMDTDPISIQVFIGKAGSRTSAWAHALARMITFALQSNSIDSVIQELSEITSDHATFVNNVQCRSTAEAISFALTEYKRQRRK